MTTTSGSQSNTSNLNNISTNNHELSVEQQASATNATEAHSSKGGANVDVADGGAVGGGCNKSVSTSTPQQSVAAATTNENNPVIKMCTADKSTKTDESLLNGLETCASTQQFDNIGGSSETSSVTNQQSLMAAAPPCATTPTMANASTMTSIEGTPMATVTSSGVITKIGTTSAATASSKQQTKSTSAVPGSLLSSGFPRVSATATSPPPTTAPAGFSFSAVAAGGDAVRLSYAQVAQHNKEQRQHQKQDSRESTGGGDMVIGQQDKENRDVTKENSVANMNSLSGTSGGGASGGSASKSSAKNQSPSNTKISSLQQFSNAGEVRERGEC